MTMIDRHDPDAQRHPLPCLGSLPLLAALVPALAPPAPGFQAAGSLPHTEEVRADTEPLWDRVWLPVGFHLDLRTGVVGSRAPEDGPGLVFDGSRVIGFEGLFELLPTPPGAQLPGEKPLAELRADVGEACAFVLADGRWGRIGVTAMDDRAVTLEYLLAASGAKEIRRDPEDLTLSERTGGLELSWTPATDAGEDARWRVVARYLHRPNGGFRAIQIEVDRPRWLHSNADGAEVVEYWVARVDAGANFGMRRRGVPGGLDAADLIPVRVGSTINLLTGEVDGARGDCRVSYLSTATMHLEPLDGARVFSLSKGGIRGGPWSWEIPSVVDVQYREQRTSLSVGGSLAFHLPEGVYARIALDGFAGGDAQLTRQVDLDGGRVFPAPPAIPAVDRLEDGGFRLSFPPLGGLGGAAQGVVLVLETEERDGSWREVGRSGPGERELRLPAGGTLTERGAQIAAAEPSVAQDVLALIRCRTRHRLATGLTSAPGERIEILPADDGSEAAAKLIIDRALAQFVEGEFPERRRARRALELLGPRAFARLEAALGAGNPDLAAAAQEVLVRSRDRLAETREADQGRSAKAGNAGSAAPGPESGGGAEAILLARARALGIDSDPPDGWTDEDAGRRALALLRTREGGVGGGGEAERARVWRGIVAESDPDATLRQLAALLDSAGREPPTAVIPWGRWRPGPETWQGEGRRGTPSSVSWAEFFADRVDVVEVDRVFERLAQEVAGAKLTSAGALLAVGHDLWSSSEGWDEGRGAMARAELALRLVDFHRAEGGAVLLEAVRELTRDAGAEIRAWRDLARLWRARSRIRGDRAGSDRSDVEFEGVEALVRGAELLEGAERRSVIRIESGPGVQADLVSTLRSLAESGRTDVDLVLGPGVHAEQVTGSSIPVGVPGLHIIGEGGGQPVVVRSGFLVNGVRGVVFENLDILATETTALVLTRGEVLMVGCMLQGRDTCLMGTDSDLLLDGCEILTPASGRPVYSVRASGRSALIARDCLLVGGSVSLLGETRGFLERCVISSGQRNAVDGGRTGRVVLVDCLVQTELAGLSNLAGALLEGVVARCGRGLIQIAQGPVLTCPDHVLDISEQPSSAPSSSDPERLERCPLWR